MSVRLYGRTVGHGSLAVVTAGFRRVLGREALLDGIFSLDTSGGSEEEDEPPGALASDGVFTGNLAMVNAMQRNARHNRHWVQVTPNSTHIPPKLLQAVLKLPAVVILSASEWGSHVIRKNLLDMGVNSDWQPNVFTVRHGVHGFTPMPQELSKTRGDYQRGCFRVVHFSTSDGQRKGTLELLRAWVLFCSTNKAPDSPELRLVLDHHAREALLRRCLDEDFIIPPGVQVLSRGDMGPEAMSRFLCQHHLMACPSRGEGFGLGVLEARASGVPVIATATTGHSAGHVQGAGVIRIHQDSKLVPIDDGPGAMAPAVDPEHIAEALSTAYQAWDGLSRLCEIAAEDVSKVWSWESQLQPLVARIKLASH